MTINFCDYHPLSIQTFLMLVLDSTKCVCVCVCVYVCVWEMVFSCLYCIQHLNVMCHRFIWPIVPPVLRTMPSPSISPRGVASTVTTAVWTSPKRTLLWCWPRTMTAVVRSGRTLLSGSKELSHRWVLSTMCISCCMHSKFQFCSDFKCSKLRVRVVNAYELYGGWEINLSVTEICCV